MNDKRYHNIACICCIFNSVYKHDFGYALTSVKNNIAEDVCAGVRFQAVVSEAFEKKKKKERNLNIFE